MEPRTVEQVESWSTRSVADGYAGLRELSDGEFSGAVRAGGAWLFMLNGRIVGVFEGSLDDFEDADATAYAAPHPSLPLLFSMQEQGGDTRAKYYTNDTPLTEVDETLSEGKFTGFVELSENVLSGDYYVAYYGGRSMSVAFVGASEQVVTGDDAFERAADEVGIYEVTDVDVEVTDVPEPEGDDDPSDVASGAATGSGATSGRASGDKTAGGGATDDRTAGGGGSSDADPAAGSATGSNVETTGDSNADPASGGSSTAGADATETDASQQPPSPAEEGTSGTAANDPSGGQPAASRPPADEHSATDERSATDQRPDRKSAGGSSAGSSDASSAQSSGTSSTGSSSTSSTGSSGASSTDPAANDPVEGSASADAGPESPSPGRAVDSERTADAAGEAAVEPESATRAESTSDSADPDRNATGSGASADAAANRPASGEAAKENDPTRDAGATGGGSSATSGEAEWRETTTIPSLDPDLSDDPDETASESRAGATAAAESDRRGASESGGRGRSRSGEGAGRSRRSGTQSGSPTEAATAGGSSASTGGSSTSAGGSGAPAGGSDTPSGRSGTSAGGSSASEGGADDGSGSSSDARTRIRKLRKQLEQRKQQVEQLKERLSTLESERDEYRRERDALSQEVERLEAKLEGAESAGGAASGRRLTETEAFDGTNLFVRYESKGEATLDEAADGQAERGDVNANLRLEHHTQFEADEASVDGDPFESFLAGSFEYEFASWIVEDLLYEIRDTGHRNALKDLYEAIPKIDRVDLHGSVSAGGDDDTRQESFDVIMRDRMGDPLVVADLNGSREPTTGEMMGSLVDAASGVADAHDELAGAFQVTESFFEPEALETAETATSGGLLSREKRASFVKRSRKRGYHLCLVESRSGDFHLNVPEL